MKAGVCKLYILFKNTSKYFASLNKTRIFARNKFKSI